MPDLALDLAFLIRAEMARRDMTQTDVAAAVGTNPSTLTRLLQGRGCRTCRVSHGSACG